MGKNYLFILATMLLIFDALGQSKISKFNIDGTVHGFSNGTILYLHDLTDGSYKKIDSAVIQNDKFVFSGNINTKYVRSNISTADFENRMNFWITNGLTTFFAEKGSFNKAIIKGSKIQDDQNKFNDLVNSAAARKEAEYAFVKNNPGSVVSAYVLSVYCSSWNKDTVKNLFKSFSKEVKATDYGKKIEDFILLNRDIKIGDPFVDFAQNDTSGKTVRLSDFKGKMVLVEFWGSWCGPCREENPALVKIYKEFKSNGFEILGVASETDKRQWIDAIIKDGLTWTNVSDLKGSNNKAAMIYGVSGYPTNFLIDKSGIIIARDVYGEDLRTFLLKK